MLPSLPHEADISLRSVAVATADRCHLSVEVRTRRMGVGKSHEVRHLQRQSFNHCSCRSSVAPLPDLVTGWAGELALEVGDITSRLERILVSDRRLPDFVAFAIQAQANSYQERVAFLPAQQVGGHVGLLPPESHAFASAPDLVAVSG